MPASVAIDSSPPDSRAVALARRHAVHWTGQGTRTLILAHGYGCDQNMWRALAPRLARDHRVMLFDHVGSGRSDLSAYDAVRHAELSGYADDLIELCDGLSLQGAVFVGHSVSSMIGMLAAIRRPELFEGLVMVAPSPCFINDADYVGGFSREDVEGLLDLLDRNYLGWASTMAPVIMNAPDQPDLASELEASFCRTEPAIAKNFARATFLSDHRAELGKLDCPTLVLQCTDDLIAPESVGQYLHERIVGSQHRKLDATGHCPHLSAPDETESAIRDFLNGLPQ